MLIIGDVHSKTKKYLKILETQKPLHSIQIGDFGYKKSYDEYIDYPIDVTRHQIIMGNHDFYPYLGYPFSLGDYGFFTLEGTDMGFVRGAETINKRSMYRVRASTWLSRGDRSDEWENYDDLCFPLDEQLGKKEFENIADVIGYRTPTVMLSHDCPQNVCEGMFGIKDKTATRTGLQKIWESHQPDIWIFGHHHRSKSMTMNGTKFICLSELETKNI